MGKLQKTTVADALHAELAAAIADLAKSVDVAARRIMLRAKLETAIAGAAETERAADALRAAALNATTVESNKTSLAPEAATAEVSQDCALHHQQTTDSASELYEACNWLIIEQSPRLALENENQLNESAIAMRILELHDRLDGSKKQR